MSNLSGLLDKLKVAQRKASEALGEFTLFGLFGRGDTPGRFDIIASAPWLTADGAGIDKIFPFLPRLVPGETSLVGSIVPLPPDTEFVQAIIRLLRGDGGYTLDNGVRALGVGGALLSDVEITRGYVIAPESRVGAMAA